MNTKEIIEFVLKASDGEIKEFIDKQTNGMKECPSFYTFDVSGMTKTNRFLSRDSEVISDLPSLVIDDSAAFEMLFKNVKNSLNPNSTLEDVLKCVQKTIFEYFGVGKQDYYARVLKYRYEQRLGMVPVSAFKECGNSWCTERAALAHDFMMLLGYESVLASKMIRMNGGKAELHAFNFVKDETGAYLFDLLRTQSSADRPMPGVIIKKLENRETIEKIFNDQIRIEEELDLGDVSFTTLNGDKVTVTYSENEMENE